MTLAVRVARATQPGPGVRVLELAPVGPEPLPACSAGSHVVLHLDGRRNAYSLIGEPWRTDAYRVAVLEVVGGRGGSRAAHGLAVGDRLELEPPRNQFAPPSPARHHVLVAGGIGVTPFLSHAHELTRAGHSFELHYADGRGHPLLEEIAAPPGALQLHAGRAALLAALDDVLCEQHLRTHLSVCGPPAMIEAVTARAAALGWPASRVHVERFGADAGPMEPFTVGLAADGRTLDVPADRSLLETLEAAGVMVPNMCRQGVCGRCLVPVAAGIPDHRDHVLTPTERAANTAVLPCVSRCAPGGHLVLEVG